MVRRPRWSAKRQGLVILRSRAKGCSKTPSGVVVSRSEGGDVATQTVVITGGTQGLGFGYARECLARGCQVVVSGRDQGRVDAASAQLRALGFEAISGLAADVAQLSSQQALWDFAIARHGRVDVWIHNAGYARTGVRFLDNTVEDIEAMVRTNVMGSVNAAQVVIAGMQRQGGGKFYLTLGGGGATGRLVPGMTVYSTTKRAVKYLFKSLLKERKEANDGILLGTISPGINITEGMLREMAKLSPEARQRGLKQLNFIGDHVETTTPWIIERVLGETRQGTEITWLTGGRLASRALASMIGRKRDVISRYSLEA